MVSKVCTVIYIYIIFIFIFLYKISINIFLFKFILQNVFQFYMWWIHHYRNLEPCIQRYGFLGSSCHEYYPSSSFVLLLTKFTLGGVEELITPCIAPLPSDVFVSSFPTGLFRGVTGIPAQAPEVAN